MIIEYGSGLCEVHGDVGELDVVRRALTFMMPKDDEPTIFLSEDNKFLTGLLPMVKAQVENGGWTVDVEGYDDPGFKGEAEPPSMDGVEDLYDFQKMMFRKAVKAGRGVLDMATGSGKTLVAAALVQWYAKEGKSQRVLYAVNNLRLMEQTAEMMAQYGIETISTVSGAGIDTESPFVIGMVQTLYRRLQRDSELREWLEGVDLLIFDEAHHLPARTWTTVALACPNAKYRFGLSATSFDPYEPRVEDYTLIGVIGSVVGHVSGWVLRRQGILAEPSVVMVYPNCPDVFGSAWHDVYKKGIVENEVRNEVVLRIAASEARAGRHVLVFVSQVKHGRALLGALEEDGCEALFCKGAMETFDSDDDEAVRQRELDEIAEWMNTPGSITIATQVFDEGLDVSGVNSIIFAGGMKNYRRVIQRVGRGLRSKSENPEENTCRIWDFEDRHHPFLKKHTRLRLEIYERERINVERHGASAIPV